MADSIANLLLKIEAQKGDAVSSVDELAAALEALDHVKSEATAQVDTDQAAFDVLQLELEKFDHKKVEAKAGVDTSEGERQLQLFSHSLDNLKSRSFTGKMFSAGDVGTTSDLFPHQGQLTIDAELDGTKAIVEAAALHEQLKLELGTIHTDVDVDKGKIDETERAVSGLNTAFGRLAQAGGGVKNAVGGLGDSIGKVTVNIGAFGLTLGPVLASVLLLAIAIGTSLVAAFIAVASSAALAVTALAAVGVALVGAFLPIAAIAIPAAIIFGKVIQDLIQQQTKSTAATNTATQATQEKSQADAQARAYAQSHADAEEQLAVATQNAADAQKAAYREMQDAIEAVTDSYRGLEHAKLSVEQSALNIEKDKQALDDFRKSAGLAGKQFGAIFKDFTDVSFDPSKLNDALSKIKAPGLDKSSKLDLEQLILNLRDDYLSQKDAVNGVSDAETALKRARQDAQPFLEKGILGSKNYQAALRGVADAQKNLARLESNRQFDLQQQAALNAAKALDAATASTGKLTGAAAALAPKLLEVFHAFEKAFGPGVAAFIDGIVKGLGFLASSAGQLKNPMTILGQTMGEVVAQFFKFLASPEAIGLFTQLAAGATQLVPLIGKVFTPMADFLGKIANAAMPLLLSGFKGIADWLGKLDANTSIKDISNFIQKNLVPSLQAWIKFALQLGPAFFDFIKKAAPEGIKFLSWITGVTKQFDAWTQSKRGRDEIHKFFTDTIPIAIGFLDVLVWIIKAFIDVVVWVSQATTDVVNWFTGATNSVSTFFSTLWDNLLQTPAQAVQPLIDAFNGIPTAIAGLPKIFGDIASFIGTNFINGLAGSLSDMGLGISKKKWHEYESWIKGIPGTLFKIGKDIANGLWDGIKGVAFSVKDYFVGKFNDAVAAIKGLWQAFYDVGSFLVNGIWKGIRAIGLDVKDWAVSRFNDAIDALKGLWNTFYDIGAFLIKGLWKGLTSVVLDVVKWIEDHIPKPIRWALKILSPSKVMEDIGRQIGKGLEVGINASGEGIQNAAMKSFAAPVVAGATAGPRSSMTIQNQNINLPAAPGHDQMGDPRHQAALFAREMRRRGWR